MRNPQPAMVVTGMCVPYAKSIPVGREVSIIYCDQLGTARASNLSARPAELLL